MIEFLDDLIKDAFLPRSLKNDDGEESQYNGGREIDFFSVTPLQTLQVNLSTDGNTNVLPHYEFLGRVLGKAIYGKFSRSHFQLSEKAQF